MRARIVPRVRDLGGGFRVRRALPSEGRPAVGPFVFFDEMGPAALDPGQGLDVRPHPHIGLATVTYLLEGEILHRDSLGVVQAIRPGEVNWMTAGRGIVHSERTPGALRAAGPRLRGLQTWVALPVEDEEVEPSFSHHGHLPAVQEGGVTLRLVLGDLLGLSSPVPTLSPMFYADAELEDGRAFVLPAAHEERAIHLLEGELEAGGDRARAGEMLVFEEGVEARLVAHGRARFMILGGPALERPRHVWWNFVSSSRDRILEAARDWKAGRFPAVPGETESIPLPDRGPPWGAVDYP